MATMTAQQTAQKANPFNAGAGGVVAPGAAQPINSVGGGAHTPHNAFVSIGGEIVFVVIVTVIAGTSPKAGTAMVAFMGALLVLLLINHFG